jgi:UDP-glucose:(heptosyl)LPS alpha-1,3-glucosyltransferase
MERYVWELTRALAAAGNPVTVVCERNYAGEHAGVAVHELGEVARRPRWLSLLRFSRRVRRWLHAHPQAGALIHSHERLDAHHVTTFHGPPFAAVFERGWWRRISLRARMQLWLERRELCSPGVRAVVPNSPLIQSQLQRYYPELGSRLSEPIAPGVAPAPERPPRLVPQDGGVIGFVGREWKRKGLDLALPIAAELRRRRPGLELWVIGPEPGDIRQLFAEWKEGYRLLGWREDLSIYPQLDLLLHPARAEPYGMVVAEAMAARVPVVVSDQCGIAPEVAPDRGSVVPVTAAAGEWARACEQQLQRRAPPPPFARSWDQVTQEYLTLYRALRGAVPSR